MIRTTPRPSLLHDGGKIEPDCSFHPELFPCLSADADEMSINPTFGHLSSSPSHLPSSPSDFTASVSSEDSKLRSPSRSWVPYRRPGALLSSALELSFTEKILQPGGNPELCLDDVQKGQPLLSAGLKQLPDKALEEAILMKHASRETRRFRALASAWQLKEARHYFNYLTCIHQSNEHEFFNEDPTLGDLLKFQHESYNEELLSVAVTNAQLGSLEAEIDSRSGSSESSTSPSSSLPSSPSRDFTPAAAKNEATTL